MGYRSASIPAPISLLCHQCRTRSGPKHPFMRAQMRPTGILMLFLSWIVTSWVKTISGVYNSFTGISNSQILPTKFAFYGKPIFNLVSLDKKVGPKKARIGSNMPGNWSVWLYRFMQIFWFFFNYEFSATLNMGEHPLLKSWHSTVVSNALHFWHPLVLTTQINLFNLYGWSTARLQHTTLFGEANYDCGLKWLERK